MKAQKCAVTKKGRLLMANSEGTKCRVFKSLGKARNFVRNIIKVSNGLTIKDFEMIRL